MPSRRHASSEAPRISCSENPESTLSRADGVDRIDKNRYRVDFLTPAMRDRALLAPLHYNQRNIFCENGRRALESAVPFCFPIDNFKTVSN